MYNPTSFTRLVIVAANFLLLSSSSLAQFKLSDLKELVESEEPKTASEPVEAVVSSPVEQLAREDFWKSAKIGAILGGVAGAVYGYEKSKDKEYDSKEDEIRGRTEETLKYAAVGAAVGGLAGGAVGKVAGDRRKHYATEHEFLEAEIFAADQAIANQKEKISDMDKDLASSKKEINELEKRFEADKNITRKAEKKLKKLNGEIEKNAKALAAYKDSIEYLEYSLETTKLVEEASDQEIKEWEGKKQDLTVRKSQLENQYATLQNYDQGLAEQSGRVVALLKRAEEKEAS